MNAQTDSPPPAADGHRPILRRVGTVLIGVGLLDIGYMVYCIAQGIAYSSSFNVFAVIGGIFLLRGHLGAVRVITFFAAFMLTGFAGAVMLLPLLEPADLLLTRLRLDPAGGLLEVAIGAALLGLLFWVYRQLRSPPVLAARLAAGRSAAVPWAAFVVGALLVVAVVGALQLLMHGESAQKALQLAQAREGPGYRYSVSNINLVNDHGRATVTAYNEHEVKDVQVEW